MFRVGDPVLFNPAPQWIAVDYGEYRHRVGIVLRVAHNGYVHVDFGMMNNGRRWDSYLPPSHLIHALPK